MAKNVITVTLLTIFLSVSTKVSAQRSNYNEDDIVIMKSQQNVCEVVVSLLEAKNVDSALTYFVSKNAASKKSIKGHLHKIANQVSAYKDKTKYPFSCSPDAPNDTVNHYICKYYNADQTKLEYQVTFVFDRVDSDFKIKEIVFPKENNGKKPSEKKDKNKKDKSKK